MKQYLNLLKEIKEKGSYKEPAREGMPGTTSLFGHQFRHNLQDGFPLLTTKKMFWKGVVVELLWFLRGDTNIKYLVDNGVNIWNEDAYNYYKKVIENQEALSFADFIDLIKVSENIKETGVYGVPNYNFGDCGFQYGKVWREWEKSIKIISDPEPFKGIDQIKNVINSIRTNPYGRRHMVTAIDPAHESDLALYWCHALFQFNCRKVHYDADTLYTKYRADIPPSKVQKYIDENNLPKYYPDCQLYQRSADVFLGVPFNIASYALLTHIIAKMCNMIPGEFIHTFGDVHIYDSHLPSVEEQITRDCKKLPTLKFSNEVTSLLKSCGEKYTIDNIFDELSNLIEDFELVDYNPHPSIKGKLFTGLR